MRKEKCIGIVGGMGPDATALFFKKIINSTPANRDQDHIKIIIYNNPKIPDRTNAILDGGENPVQAVVEGLKFLENGKVDVIAIPCVTIHHFYEELIKELNTPVMNLVDETAKHIKKKFPKNRQIGILATKGTYQGQIFERGFKKYNLVTIVPDEKCQEKLMESIYSDDGIKAGYSTGAPKEKIVEVTKKLTEKGAEIIVGGCTEIPIAIQQLDLDVPFIDSLDVLAKAVISKVGVTPKNE